MKSPFLSVRLLLFLVCLTPGLHAQSHVAIANSTFQVKYPIDYDTQKIFSTEKMPCLGEDKEAYFIKYDFGNATHIVELPKRNENNRAVSYREGKFAQVNGTFFIDFEKGLILIEQGKTYPVVSMSDGKVEIVAMMGDEKRRVPFPDKYFRVVSMEEYNAALERQRERSSTPVATLENKPPPPSLSADQLKQLAAQESQKAQQLHASRQKTRFVPVETPEDAVGLITTAEGSGTGFLCYMDGVVYFFTNSHVVGSGREMEIRLRDGTKVKPQLIEFAKDRDLARLSIDDQPASLAYTDRASIGEDVTVYGNSDGAGVITRTRGQINGDAHDRIETTAGFVPGNSGSPIVNESGEVVGVATYAIFNPGDDTDWTRKGTRFDAVRRFGVKLDEDILWVPFHPEALAMINGEIMDGESAMMQSIVLMAQYYNEPFEPILVPDINDAGLQQWVTAHNAVVKEYAALQSKSYAQHEITKVIEIIRNRGMAKGRSLSKFFDRQAERMEGLPLIPETAFHAEKVEELEEGFSVLSEANDKLNETMW